MFKQLQNIDNSNFKLKLANILALQLAVGTNSYGQTLHRLFLQSGGSIDLPLTEQNLTDVKASGLTAFNNDLIHLRRPAIQSVTIPSSMFFPSGGSAEVVVQFNNGTNFTFTPKDENTYNQLFA